MEDVVSSLVSYSRLLGHVPDALAFLSPHVCTPECLSRARPPSRTGEANEGPVALAGSPSWGPFSGSAVTSHIQEWGS